MKPELSIESFEIRNFKGIKHTSIKKLPSNAPWIFITGENGFGKTSILQALASAMAGEERHNFDYFDLQESNVKIKVKLHFFEDSYGVESNIAGKNNWIMFPDNMFNQENGSLLACYGASRLDTYSQSSTIKPGITEALFDSTSRLLNIEYQLADWYLKRKDVPKLKKRYESIITLFKELLNLKDIEIDVSGSKNIVYYIEQDENGEGYEKMTLNNLASGYRSIMAMVGDLILRLEQAQSKVDDVRDFKGIVIIDELDLHFHPKWQKQLPYLLSRSFPNIQFIASTHSPIPLLGAPANSVFLTVDRSVEEGITVDRMRHLENKINKLTPNLILDSAIFGYAEIFPRNYRSNTLNTAESRSESEFKKELEKAMSKGLSEEKRKELESLLNK